jgi:hypothetical protein
MLSTWNHVCRWNTSSNYCDKGRGYGFGSSFLLARPDFSQTELVKAYAYSIVAPAMDYWKQTITIKTGARLARMKVVRIFNPLHFLGTKISVSDIDELKIFKFYEHHEIRPQIELMKTEVIKYQALAGSIKSFEDQFSQFVPV